MVILVPIDFAYTTSYRLSIVTFALRRCVLEQKLLLTAYIGSRIGEIDWY